LFELETTDYTSWAKGLKSCGYATNPKYPQLIIKLIEENKLHEFDIVGQKYIQNNELPPHAGNAVAVAQTKANNSSKKKSSKQIEGAEITIANNRSILKSSNGAHYVVAKENDSLEKIARDLDLNVFFIKRFNDWPASTNIQAGQIIYIKPKRNRGKEDSVKSLAGESLWSISQAQGVKLKRLKKYNPGLRSDELSPGTTVLLKKKH
jgi:LysM repeat protein